MSSPTQAPPREHWPTWAEPASSPNSNLPNLLTIASMSFERHTNWYLRHCETGIRNLAAIIAAEAAIVGIYFTHLAQKGVPVGIVSALLLGVLALAVAPFLCSLAIRSSTRAFLASMESTRLMTKCIWAMGLTAKVAVNDAVADLPQYADDQFLYPKRWTLGPVTGSE